MQKSSLGAVAAEQAVAEFIKSFCGAFFKKRLLSLP